MNANADNLAVARNALTGYGAWAVSLGIGLVVTPILLRGLGEQGFGTWTLAVTVTSYFAMVELGLGVATARRLASSLAVGDIAATSVVAASARATYLAIAAFGSLVLFGLVTVPALVGRTAGIFSGSVRLTVLILGLGYLIALTVMIYPVIAVGMGRVDLGTMVGVATGLATALAQVAVALASKNLTPLAIVTAVGFTGNTLAVRSVTRRRLPELDLRLANARLNVSRELLSSGWRNAAIVSTFAVAFQTDVIIVAAILGPTAVAAYGIAVRASTMARALATRAADVLVPTFAHSTTVGDNERTVSAFQESIFLTRAILMPVLISIAAFGRSLLHLWLGEVPKGAMNVLLLLLVGAIVAAPGYSSFVLLTGMNRLRYLLIGSSVTALANLSLSVLLTRQYGIVGPALGSLAGFLVWDLFVLPRHVASLLHIPWLRVSFAGMKTLAFPALGTAALAWVTHLAGWGEGREGVTTTSLVGIVYAVLVWIALNSEQRTRYRRLITRAKPWRLPAGRSN
jgi:O-antigen/teichoic acid export membrane protein